MILQGTILSHARVAEFGPGGWTRLLKLQYCSFLVELVDPSVHLLQVT